MNNSFISVKLSSLKTINVVSFGSLLSNSGTTFDLCYKNDLLAHLSVKKVVSQGDLRIFELEMPFEFEFGKDYDLSISDCGSYKIDISEATQFSCFDERFNYDGDDLGSFYSKERTTFALWAPLATKVYLRIRSFNDNIPSSYIRMKRSDKGVYRVTLEGDYLNYCYTYMVTNSGVTRECIDPYGKSNSFKGKYTAIVDINRFLKETKYTRFKNNIPLNEAILYETSVRDFTSFSDTDIENKGKFLGFVEANRTTKNGKKAGLDYLSSLGITHVQLLPILDFARIKDDIICKEYNWGYDPLSFFAIEGSYSVIPESPSSRLYEFKTMIKELHHRHIGVVMDVVYNHLFHFELFENIVPNYYFRRLKSGRFSNASGCGNDFASERYMSRKLIVDSVSYFIDCFDIDGIRMDLMGLLDIATIKAIENMAKGKKDNFYIYGEGWDMTRELPDDQKATIYNAFKMPHIGFFNDTFRDIVKGNSFDLASKGYIAGDPSYNAGLIYALLGSCVNYTYSPKFLTPSQSINFIECHDNFTVYDKLKVSNADENEDIRLKRLLFGNLITILSYGVSFIHMGQEYGATKYGNGNTYISGDKYNQLNYSLKDKREFLVNDFIKAIKLKKELPFLSINKPNIIDKLFDIYCLDNGVVSAVCNKKQYIPKEYKRVAILMNPSIYDYKTNIIAKKKILYSTVTDKKILSMLDKGIIPPLSVTIVGVY